MIINGKHVDPNDYFVPIKGSTSDWKCIIRGCAAHVKAESKTKHLRWVHYKLFGLEAPPIAQMPAGKVLTKYPRERLVEIFNNLPDGRIKLEVPNVKD